MFISRFQIVAQPTEQTLQNKKKMNFREMPTLRVSIFTHFLDFNQTSACLKRGLDSDMKQKCKTMPGLWPNAAGAMQFFTV
jgi:hypothetical protein